MFCPLYIRTIITTFPYYRVLDRGLVIIKDGGTKVLVMFYRFPQATPVFLAGNTPPLSFPQETVKGDRKFFPA